MCNLSPEDPPGSLLPSQYFEHVRRRKLLNGEYRLLLAVLEDAIRSYLSNLGARRGEERAILAEVRVWFFARGNSGKQGLFAFESICELLGIEPDIVRKRLAGTARPSTNTSGAIELQRRLLRQSSKVSAKRT